MARLSLSRRSKGRVYWLDRRTRAELRRALTAAAAPSSGNGKDDPYVSLHQPWQARAFGFYNKMGECWNPANFAARAVKKIRLFPARINERGEEEEIKEGWAYDLVSQWQEIPEPYARLIALIGEGRFTQSRPPDGSPSDPPVWEFLSPTELRKHQDGKKLLRRHGTIDLEYVDISGIEGAGDPEPGQMRMWRFWRPHPENSGMADSAFRGVLDYYEQLWWITLGERSDLRNRVVNAGLLLIPEEIEFEAPGADDVATDEDPEVDPFNELIAQITTAALSNPGSAEAASPGVVRAEAELLHPDKFRILKFHDPSSSLYVSGREEALRLRIATSLPLPNEAFLGLTDSNHWTAWKVEDEKTQFVMSEVDQMLEDLTRAVLRPIGRASGQSDADEIYVQADYAELVSDPDKGKTAIELRKIGAVGDEYVREANDVDQTAGMTPEERAEWLAIQLRDATLLGGEEETEETAPEQREEPPSEDDSEEEAPEPGLTQRFAYAAVRLSEANVANWLRTKRRSCPECIEAIDGADDDRVVSLLGIEGLRGLGVTLDQVTARQRDVFYRTLGQFGCELDWRLAAKVEEWIAARILLPPDSRPPLPPAILAAISP